MNAALDVDYLTDAGEVLPEYALWCAALVYLLDDARAYWKGSQGLTQEQAFDDVLRVGPMLRHLCSYTGHDPHWIAEGFCRGLENKNAPIKPALKVGHFVGNKSKTAVSH